MIKQFTTLQLFSLTDGRLGPGGMDDVYNVLNHIFDSELTTIALPIAFDRLKEINPPWFDKECRRLEAIRAAMVSNTFETLIGAIKDKYNETVDVPQIDLYP